MPREHDGRGVACPACQRLLRIPAPDETAAPLVVAEEPSRVAAGDLVLRRRKRSRHSGKTQEPDWESGDVTRSSHADRRWMARFLIGGALALAVILAGVAWVLKNKSGDTPVAVAPQARPVPEKPAQPAETAPRSTMSFLTDSKPVVEHFLNATDTVELLRWVRDPAVAGPRIKEAYPGGRVEAPGMAEYNTKGVCSVDDGVFSVDVRTRDFTSRVVNLVDSPDGPKVDWESWVAWCGMSWDRFTTERPAAAVEFRVFAKKIDYYNFAFSDEGKWRCYRLVSLDGDQSLYGYVERGSAVEAAFPPGLDSTETAFTLELRYPENAPPGSKQVLISAFKFAGWSAPAGTPESPSHTPPP